MTVEAVSRHAVRLSAWSAGIARTAGARWGPGHTGKLLCARAVLWRLRRLRIARARNGALALGLGHAERHLRDIARDGRANTVKTLGGAAIDGSTSGPPAGHGRGSPCSASGVDAPTSAIAAPIAVPRPVEDGAAAAAGQRRADHDDALQERSRPTHSMKRTTVSRFRLRQKVRWLRPRTSTLADCYPARRFPPGRARWPRESRRRRSRARWGTTAP